VAVTGRYAHSYGAYLNSPQWGQRRREALRRAGYRCIECGATEGLEVHHLTYERLGYERPEDLTVLCNPCHAKEHGRPARGNPAAGPTASEFAKRAEATRQLEAAQAREILLAKILNVAQGLEEFQALADEHGWRTTLEKDRAEAFAAVERINLRLLGIVRKK
jgi:hypothetical protein